MNRPSFRLVEDPLGPDVLQPPTREEVAQLWARIKDQPVPYYTPASLRRLPARRPGGGA